MTWYEAVSGPDLQQGDLLPGLPVIQTLGSEDGAVLAEKVVIDALVMTQSCDLDTDSDRRVLLAQINEWGEFCTANELSNGQRRSLQKKIRRREKPDLALLAPFESTPELMWSVVDFEQVYTVQLMELAEFADRLGARLRLTPPYREAVAQQFGAYYSRVAREDEPVEFDSWEPSAT